MIKTEPFSFILMLETIFVYSTTDNLVKNRAFNNVRDEHFAFNFVSHLKGLHGFLCLCDT